MQAKLDTALKALNSLISDGYEFPDAVYKTSQMFKLSAKEVKQLEAMYDYQE